MGRIVRQLGSLSGADMSITPDGKNFAWSTSDLPDPVRIFVKCGSEPRKLYVAGRGGSQPITWIIPGRVCTFQLEAAGKLVMLLEVDSRQGFPVRTKIVRVGAAGAPTTAPAPSPSSAAIAAPITAALPGGEMIPGIPDTYLMIGGGVLAILLLSKKGTLERGD